MSQKGKSTKWVIGIAVIASAIVVISLLNLGDNVVYFYTPEEAVAKAPDLRNKTIRVGAMVKEGSRKWVAEQLQLDFVMTDYEGHDIQVSHKGTPPDLFKEGQGVVVEGRLSEDGKTMKSHKLMVKHSEEYREPEDGKTIEPELLQKSIFKDQ